MTASDWNAALAPKVRGTLNIDAVFGGGGSAGGSLDFFLMLSSAVAVSGNAGQSNYGAACSFQDALARQRVNGAGPTTAAAPKCSYYSINVGVVIEVGFVAENPAVAEALRKAGLGALHLADLLSVVNYAVTRQDSAAAGAAAAGWSRPRGGCVAGMVPPASRGSGVPRWMRERRFAHLVHQRQRLGAGGEQRGSSDGVAKGTEDLASALSHAAGPKEAVDIVGAAILQQLGKLIATPVEMLSPARSLDNYGVDSLVAVELRNWIGTYLRANVQLMVLRGTSSINELAGIVARESRLVSFEEA